MLSQVSMKKSFIDAADTMCGWREEFTTMTAMLNDFPMILKIHLKFCFMYVT